MTGLLELQFIHSLKISLRFRYDPLYERPELRRVCSFHFLEMLVPVLSVCHRKSYLSLHVFSHASHVIQVGFELLIEGLQKLFMPYNKSAPSCYGDSKDDEQGR